MSTQVVQSARVNINRQADEAVRAVTDRLIAEGREIGLQVAAYLDGELVVDVATGVADPATGREVDADTLFNVFSVTKAVVATALHLQVDRGLIGYEDRVVAFWPEYGAHGKESTTVRDVLTHRAGVPHMPPGVTPELMLNWDWMVGCIAQVAPLRAPGSTALYQSMTFGWLVGELVRRTDPKRRSIGTFIREEIAEPLSIPDLWVGLPDSVAHRTAVLVDAMPDFPKPELYAASIPPAVELVPSVFNRADVRRGEIGGVGGVFTARSCARFWAMLAQGGELDGARLLSSELVATFNTPRDRADQPDVVMFGWSLPLSIAGFWLGGHEPPVAAAKYPRAICHPAAGNSIGFADGEQRLAVAICHNRMIAPSSRDEDPTAHIADAIRTGLGLE